MQLEEIFSNTSNLQNNEHEISYIDTERIFRSFERGVDKIFNIKKLGPGYPFMRCDDKINPSKKFYVDIGYDLDSYLTPNPLNLTDSTYKPQKIVDYAIKRILEKKFSGIKEKYNEFINNFNEFDEDDKKIETFERFKDFLYNNNYINEENNVWISSEPLFSNILNYYMDYINSNFFNTKIEILLFKEYALGLYPDLHETNCIIREMEIPYLKRFLQKTPIYAKIDLNQKKIFFESDFKIVETYISATDDYISAMSWIGMAGLAETYEDFMKRVSEHEGKAPSKPATLEEDLLPPISTKHLWNKEYSLSDMNSDLVSMYKSLKIAFPGIFVNGKDTGMTESGLRIKEWNPRKRNVNGNHFKGQAIDIHGNSRMQNWIIFEYLIRHIKQTKITHFENPGFTLFRGANGNGWVHVGFGQGNIGQLKLLDPEGRALRGYNNNIIHFQNDSQVIVSAEVATLQMQIHKTLRGWRFVNYSEKSL